MNPKVARGSVFAAMLPERISLASTSPRRCQLLRRLGVTAVVVPSTGDEASVTFRSIHGSSEPTADHAIRLAIARARVKADGATPAPDAPIVLAADTVVFAAGRLLGKPTDVTAAGAMLARLSGAEHLVATAVTLRVAPTRTERFCEVARVRVRTLSEEDVAWYVATEEWRGVAGGYRLQGAGNALIETVVGDPSTVVGLPLGRLYATLTSLRRS